MKNTWLVVNLKIDKTRFTAQEIKFHLQRAIEDYIFELEDDDEDGIQLGEVSLLDVDPRELLGGNS